MRPLVVTLTLLALASIAVLPGSADARNMNGYRALGATVKTFYSDNPGCPSGVLPPHYSFCYKVDATKGGRVTAFHVVMTARHRYSARHRLALAVDMVPVPTRATTFNSTYCTVLRSSTLGKLIGMQYAAATTTRSGKPTAYMRAERSPHC
jgi:hypothetical protein